MILSFNLKKVLKVREVCPVSEAPGAYLVKTVQLVLKAIVVKMV